jgi:hypothetical protein
MRFYFVIATGLDILIAIRAENQQKKTTHSKKIKASYVI